MIPTTYGIAAAGLRKKSGTSSGSIWCTCWGVLTLFFLPVLVYVITSLYAMYLDGWVSWLITILWLIGPVLWALRQPPYFVLSSSLVWAMIIGQVYGNYLHYRFIAPHEDITALNTYPNVDPSLYQGQQLMDAGVIEFAEGSHLDISKSFGFKNEDTYCVAPIVGPKTTGTMANYDFWAVGLNCCSGHAPDYHCGEFSNPRARKGLRLMRDDERNFFRLTVEEATAAFNIQAKHPVFLYWMENPKLEINAYEDVGISRYFTGLFLWGSIQLLYLVGYVMYATGMLQGCCGGAGLFERDRASPTGQMLI